MIVRIETALRVFLPLLCACGVAFSQTAEEYQRQASELARSFQFPKAVELLQTGLRQHPGNLELVKQLGLLLVQTGKAGEGARLLRESLARQPHQLDLLGALGEAELRQGRPRAAVTLFEDLAWHRPEDAQIQHRLARALFLSGEFQRALEPALRSVELDPSDPALRRFYSLLLDVQGKKEDSYYQLKAAHELEPQNDSILFQLGEKQRQAGKPKNAVAWLEKASRLDPENPLYRRSLSEVYEELGQKGLAAQERERAGKLADAFESYARALNLATSGDLQAAVDVLHPPVQKNPEFVTGALFLARLFSRMGHQERALDLYLTLAKRFPIQIAAKQEAAWILAQQGHHQQALEALGEVPDEDAGRTLIAAYSREQAGDYAGAVAALRRVESANPLNADLLLWIAHCLHAGGQHQKALEALSKADKLRPANAVVQAQLRQIRISQQREAASQFFQQRRWQAALRELAGLRETRGHQTDDAPTVFQMAYCHQQLGNLKEALQHYRAGLQVDPEASWARQNLAAILYQLGQYQDAASQWERIPAKQRSPEIWQQLGFCYAYLGRYEAADNSFQTAFSSGLATPALLYHLGLAHLRKLQPEEGWRLIRRSAAANYQPAKNLLKQQARLSR